MSWCAVSQGVILKSVVNVQRAGEEVFGERKREREREREKEREKESK